MAKPVKFALKGEGVVEVSKENEKEYLKALSCGEDVIKVCVEASCINILPIMRNQVQPNDPAFMLSGGFEVERIEKSNKYKILIDGVVSTESLKKKDIDLISAGTATCTLENVGTQVHWYFDGENVCVQIAISVAPGK